MNVPPPPSVVTKILRDQRVPIIWFVANCGGILGLCMGFSIVTVFEVLHYICRSIFLTCNFPCRKRNNDDTMQEQCRRSDTANTFLKQTAICNTIGEQTELVQR